MSNDLITIQIVGSAGSIARDKDVARRIRTQLIEPALQQGKDVVLDFKGVEESPQSFIHALISQVMRCYGAAVLDRITFKSCNQTVKQMVMIVVDYMQREDEPNGE